MTFGIQYTAVTRIFVILNVALLCLLVFYSDERYMRLIGILYKHFAFIKKCFENAVADRLCTYTGYIGCV